MKLTSNIYIGNSSKIKPGKPGGSLFITTDTSEIYIYAKDGTYALASGSSGSPGGASPIFTEDTAGSVDMSSTAINYCNMASANSNTAYSLTDVVAGGKAKILINAASQPVVASATLIAGSSFQVSTNMYLWIENNGNRSEYWFEEI